LDLQKYKSYKITTTTKIKKKQKTKKEKKRKKENITTPNTVEIALFYSAHHRETGAGARKSSFIISIICMRPQKKEKTTPHPQKKRQFVPFWIHICEKIGLFVPTQQ
jgi:hypothetical protein